MKPTTFVAICGVLFVTSLASGQDSLSKNGESKKEETFERKLIDRTIAELKFSHGDKDAKPMESKIILRWPNPVRQVEDGATAIWIEKGRPQAGCCVWTDNGHLSFCFGLLSAGPVLAELDGQTLWNPKRPGPSMTSFQPIPNASAPAKDAGARLRQMKELARRFSSKMVDPTGKHEPLRLLASPLYRYDIAAADSQQPVISDGALFGFVMGTDPESLLMIEARQTPNGDQWQYAAAKRTDGLVEILLDDKLVASLATRCVPYNPESDLACLHRRVTNRQ